MLVTVDFHEGAQMPQAVGIEPLVTHALVHMSVPEACEVAVSVVSPEEIQELNADYRGVDNVTDVLSFCCDDPWTADPQDPCIALGDIVVCPAVIDEQRKEFGTSFVEEASLMIVHSVLHLLGYDHMNDEERAQMESKEKEILEAYGIVGVR